MSDDEQDPIPAEDEENLITDDDGSVRASTHVHLHIPVVVPAKYPQPTIRSVLPPPPPETTSVLFINAPPPPIYPVRAPVLQVALCMAGPKPPMETPPAHLLPSPSNSVPKPPADAPPRHLLCPSKACPTSREFEDRPWRIKKARHSYD